MERGKVQVSASELLIIANLLNTPIEFFYGEEIGDQYTSDIVTYIEKRSAGMVAPSLYETVENAFDYDPSRR